MLVSSGQAQGMPESLARFLQQSIGMTQHEIGAAGKGRPFVKVLESPDREVAVFGIVGIGVPRKFYVDQIGNLPSWVPQHAPAVLGAFPIPLPPPTFREFPSLTMIWRT
jgi:hypothetical protein